MDERRSLRVSEAVKEELAEIVGFEMGDPRLAAVDVTEVKVSPDLRHAHVKVAVVGGEAEEKKALAALDHARGFLRHELASRMNLRRAPELHFAADPWAEADARVEILLRRAKKTRGRTENQP
ncbi:MAG: 30S ribosome-binding factor RbfA [Acidobacteria bacterium]|nr:30S ribosome-binding factor RbfA [Acidobacteriota bacterium]MBI3473753.1 30S ribosome-binding factor RbfA [Candidatus Solibacter usitatus]